MSPASGFQVPHLNGSAHSLYQLSVYEGYLLIKKIKIILHGLRIFI